MASRARTEKKGKEKEGLICGEERFSCRPAPNRPQASSDEKRRSPGRRRLRPETRPKGRAAALCAGILRRLVRASRTQVHSGSKAARAIF